jgi:hypothetical protein
MTNVWCDVNGRFVVFSHGNQNSTVHMGYCKSIQYLYTILHKINYKIGYNYHTEIISSISNNKYKQ